MKRSGHPSVPTSAATLIAALALRIPILAAAALMVTAATCSPDGAGVTDEITVVVDVSGVTSDISSLFVSSALNGGTPQSSPDITSRLDQFAIALPTTTSGQLSINVVGRSAERCVVATGKATVDIKAPPTRYSVTVALSPTAPGAAKACTLTVNVLGKGTITSTPAGIQCVGTSKLSKPTTCTYDFPVGTPITLSSTTDTKSYGTSYSGLCEGGSGCSFTFNAPGSITAGIAARVCSSGNWCWYNPLPQGNTLRAIWGSSGNDIWASGDAGTLLHYDGANWSSPTPTGMATTQDLYGLYGTSDSDAWAVGTGGALVRWDGSDWKATPQSGVTTNQTLRSVWGSAANDYWAVGGLGTILH